MPIGMQALPVQPPGRKRIEGHDSQYHAPVVLISRPPAPTTVRSRRLPARPRRQGSSSPISSVRPGRPSRVGDRPRITEAAPVASPSSTPPCSASDQDCVLMGVGAVSRFMRARTRTVTKLTLHSVEHLSEDLLASNVCSIGAGRRLKQRAKLMVDWNCNCFSHRRGILPMAQPSALLCHQWKLRSLAFPRISIRIQQMSPSCPH
jgi:hypothetical protein